MIYPANTQGRPLHPGSSHSVEDVGALRARRPVRVAAHDHHRRLVQRRHAVRISGNRHFRRYRLPAVPAIEKLPDCNLDNYDNNHKVYFRYGLSKIIICT